VSVGTKADAAAASRPIPAPAPPRAPRLARVRVGMQARVSAGLPRRLRFHRSGWAVCVSALCLGVAAIATGNNLLFLLLGAILGFIALSGFMSEQVLRGVEPERLVPVGAVAGAAARITYSITNRKRRIPSFALELGERDGAERGFVASVEPGGTVRTGVDVIYPRRGVYPLNRVTLATSFPFGLFTKERDVVLPGVVTVWPRSDLSLPERRPPGRRRASSDGASSSAQGARGEFRALRDHRVGDDPRDVHWRSSARRAAPVVREYDRDLGETVRIAVELFAESDAAGDRLAEIAASLAARAYARGEAFSLATVDEELSPGAGPRQFERALDLLARSRFRRDAPRLRPTAHSGAMVLVAPAGTAAEGWGALLTPEAAG
jgi:uncharacterized protein (DUF58 family)